MKKITLITLSLIMAFTLVGCSTDKQDAIANYINEDVAMLSEIEVQVSESFNGVVGDNYTSDQAIIDEFKTNTISLAEELYNAAVEVAENISDEDVKAVHNKYVEFSEKFLEGVTDVATAIENQDTEQATAASDVIAESDELFDEYLEELQKLAEENSVEIETE